MSPSVGAGENCPCPFCSPGGLPVADLTGLLARRWRTWLFVTMLLFGGVLSVESRGGTHRSSGPVPAVREHRAAVIANSQTIHINESTDYVTECGGGGCHCRPTGKCKRCSRFEIGRQATECLLTGYKVRAYCPDLKREMYQGCHYRRDPDDTRNFVLFEVAAVLIGATSYAVVYVRHRRIERMIRRRIQQQIDA